MIDDGLQEWNYGESEGKTTAEMREKYGAGWSVWNSEIVGGESVEQVGERADGVWLGTFHAFCMELVLREGNSNMQVLNDVDKLELHLRRDADDPQSGQVRTSKAPTVSAGYQDAVAEYFRRLASRSASVSPSSNSLTR